MLRGTDTSGALPRPRVGSRSLSIAASAIGLRGAVIFLCLRIASAISLNFA